MPNHKIEHTMKTISDELFGQFLNGDASAEDTMLVLEAMKENPELQERYISVKRYDAIMEAENRDELPLERKAAEAEDSLCTVMCEKFILENKLKKYQDRTLLSEVREDQAILKGAEEARRNKGTSIYNVGRILESYRLSVTRQFDCSVDHLRTCIKNEEAVIVVVNEEILENKESDNIPNHAVCILSVSDNEMELFNPATGNSSDRYPLDIFNKAWGTSNNFAACANYRELKEYNPAPVDLSGIELGEDLDDLTEALAEHAHDIWARQRLDQGWKYGEVRSDEEKTNPDLVPYSDLSEQEKEYDRQTSMQTLKLLKRLGYDITHNSEDDCHCPECDRKITLDMSYCPSCGRYLQLKDFVK